MVAKAMAYLEKQVKPDGGIYNKQLANYTTCVALVAFKGGVGIKRLSLSLAPLDRV